MNNYYKNYNLHYPVTNILDNIVFFGDINIGTCETCDEDLLRAFNKWLNEDFNWGVVINDNGDYESDENKIDWEKYRTLFPDEFEDYQVGTCWDFTDYEAIIFENIFRFKKSLGKLREKTYSLYYIELEDEDGDRPSHTWLSYILNGRVYVFESAWRKYKGIHFYPSEKAMLKDYAEKFIKNNGNGPVTVYKYPRNYTYSLTVEQFMNRCHTKGNLVYSNKKEGEF